MEKKWVFRDLGGEPVEPQVTYSYEYNSQNALTKTTMQVGTQSFYHFYEYDRLGQLIKVYTSTDGNKPAQADVVYSYNPVGAVDTLRYGEQPGGGFTMELPYQYNLREWLTDIADVTGGAAPFAAKYGYLGNGNIRLAEYNNQYSPMEPRYRYLYAYDNANRLINANYFYYTGSGFTGANRFKVTGLQYDGNGNILALTRYKEDNSVIDQLSYSYTAGSNKLASLTDAVATTPEDWDAEDSEFSYDGNGNVVEMLENGQPAISAITYDHRNLPTSLINRNGDLVTYRYNAGGQRIFKKVGSQTPEHYILDGDQTVAVYQNGAVKYWNILANGVVGRYEPGSGGKFYYLKDHLGSTRVVVDAAGNVKEALDYYPFGLLMPGRIYQSGSETKEKFTGKERDAETNWDYFGARFYWAAFGRFFVVDNFANEYPSSTPYHYTLNNPLNFIDVNGDSVEVGYVWTAPMAYHTLIIYTDENTGQQKNIAEGMPSSRGAGIASGSSESSSSGSSTGVAVSSASGTGTGIAAGSSASSSGASGSGSLGNAGWGNLEAKITNKPESISSENRETVTIPKGMTEEEFVVNIKTAFQSYDNSVRYAPVPVGNRGNSNSLVGSVLRAAGSNFTPGRWAPGWNKNVLPSQRKK